MLLEHIGTVIKQKKLISPGERVLVAVSGGADSLCLLHLLRRLEFHLVVAHLDHGLRGESQSDAQAVAAIAQALGLPFVLGQENVSEYADRHGMALEEAARQVRYRFLFEQAKIYDTQVVAVGHTADDQVETVLMHLLRGTGLSGLRGMVYCSLPNPWSQHIPLVRPLLDVWREQVLAYISENGLNPVQDLSNLDTRYHRNRLRHELIPQLEMYNPGIRQVLWRMADTLASDFDIIQKQTASASSSCLLKSGDGYLLIDHRRFLGYDLGIQRQLIRRFIGLLRPGLRDIDYAAVERGIDFFNNQSTSGFCDLIAGLYLLTEGENIWLAAYEADLPHDNWPQLSWEEDWALDIPGTLVLNGGWRFVARILEPNSHVADAFHRQIAVNDDPYQAWFDFDNLNLPLKVRTRLPGDRLQPLGMPGKSVKLSDFMINVKLPRRARSAWPLVCSTEDIAWLPGYRIGHDFRVRSDTKRIAHLVLEHM